MLHMKLVNLEKIMQSSRNPIRMILIIADCEHLHLYVHVT